MSQIVGEHSVIALVRERWTSGTNAPAVASIDLLRALVFTVEDGQIRPCRILEADQPAVDEWIERYGPAVTGA